jgi:hypothetical protein
MVLAALIATAGGSSAGEPLRLHPENPHYFLFRGKPTVLVTSGEHYGAVLNLDFDYAAYLDQLRDDGLNHTRTWLGTYRELPGTFGITGNTLAPHENRYASPWARSTTPGYFHGGNKFDLTRWDEAFFARLRDFLTRAAACGVVVELNLFCPNYEESLWQASPLNATNNVNGIGNCKRDETYTLKHQDLLGAQEAVVRKVVEELKDFDNLYYEICNEAYFGGVTLEWQHFIAGVIADAEKDFPAKHLISQNVANGSARVEKPHPAISIFNFHYAVPPEAVAVNYALGKPIGENETGFRGKEDVTYRTEGWDFIIAGGSVYNNLDYSFTTSHPRGDFLDYTSPGGGSPALRRQLRVLKDFIHGFDFIRMAPAKEVLKGGIPEGLSARVLAEPGRQYAIYLHRPAGRSDFSIRWSGRVTPERTEAYTFHAVSNDGVRLWVGGKLLVDDWTDHSAREKSGTIDLEAGRKVEVRMEYYQGGGDSAARLLWSSAGGKKGVVPAERLEPPDGQGRGLRGEYFEGKDLKKLKMTRTDATIDFGGTSWNPFRVEVKDLKLEPELDLPAGRYRADWINPSTGAVEASETIEHPGGPRRLPAPRFTEDLALRLKN